MSKRTIRISWNSTTPIPTPTRTSSRGFSPTRPTRAISWSYSCGKLNDTPTFSRRSSRGYRRGCRCRCPCRRRGMPAYTWQRATMTQGQADFSDVLNYYVSRIKTACLRALYIFLCDKLQGHWTKSHQMSTRYRKMIAQLEIAIFQSICLLLSNS